ncbi:MAG: FecR anti-FecI sigma factor [Puniceicoccaceae bacterium 5H]|nr:MAG: FecR anti-FecI sigma factor [Puniceicoccaceae bacterium 5H]
MKEDAHSDAFTALCLRYLSGEAGSEDRRQLVAALQDPQKKAHFAALEKQWNGVGPASVTEPSFEAEAAFEQFRRTRMPASPPSVPQRRKGGRRPGLNLPLFFFAGCLAVAIAAYFWNTTQVDGPAPEKWVERLSPPGQSSVLTLSDGTRIYLNADSHLYIPTAFGATDRRVRLEGEAFFEVTHDPEHPFVVDAGGLRTTVLGTKFNLKAYDDSPVQAVSLVEGRVAVTPPAGTAGVVEPVVLKPGSAFELDRETRQSSTHPFDLSKAATWRFNRLTFDDTPLPEAARMLGRRFGVPVEVQGTKAAQHHLTAEFEHESLEEILDVLGKTEGLHSRVVRNSTYLEKVIFEVDAEADIP